MAKFVLKNAWVTVNSVDLSDHVRRVVVTMSTPEVEVTAMGDGGTKRLGGIPDDSFEVEFFQDFAASSVDATLAPLVQGGSAFVLACAAAGSGISATNPKYSGTVRLFEWSPIDGAIGDAGVVSVPFPVEGTISRATA